MFSFVVIKSGHVWFAVAIHAVFDVGGRIVTTLGYGAFQDVIFWILTISVGTVIGVYVAVSLFKMQKSR